MKTFLSYLRQRLLLTGKGYLRALAFSAALVLLLACVLGAVFSARERESEEGAVKIKIGMVGSLEDTYIDLGLFALQHFDSSKYYVEILTLDEVEAEDMLSAGELSGYVIVPEGFARAALRGEEVSLDYVCADTPATLVPQLMNEVVSVVSDYVTYSQNGIYSFMALCRAAGIPHSEYGSSVDILAAKYLKTILARDSVWTVNEGVPAGQLGYVQYYALAAAIVLVLLSGIALCPVMIREDLSHCRLLRFRGLGSLWQILAEYLSFFFLLWAGCGAVIVAATVFSVEGIELPLAFGIIPALLLLSAMQFFLYEISTGVIGGVLLQLLCTVSMSLVSGFIFPFGGLPRSVRAIGYVMPTRVSFECVFSCLTGGELGYLWAVETAVLLFAAAAVREFRVRGGGK